MAKHACVLSVLLLLAGCGSSPPTHFVTLDPTVPARGQVAGPTPRIVVGRVTLPAMLDRLSFVTREGPNRIAVSDQDRWAAPLDGMIQRVLATDLGRLLPAGAVLEPGDPVARDARTLTVSIRTFLGDRSGRVTLEADWSVSRRGRPPDIHHETIAKDAGSAAAAAIAAAMSQALGELSGRIAAALQGRA